jgi:flagellar M-ring protein FliF
MPEPESTMVSHLLQSPYFPVLIALMALMLLIIMVFLLRKRSTGDMQETGSGFETIAEEELRLEDLIDKTLTPEEKERQRIRQEVERFIEDNPEDAVQVVRIWLSEDSR